MIKHIAFILVLLFALPCHSQNVYSAKQGDVSFFSEAPLENIEAHSKNINSFINVATKEIAFIISIRGFKFQKSLMQEHFNEKYLESDKFPNATFQGKITGNADLTVNGTYPLTASGKMIIHGVEKSITQTGTVVVNNNTLSMTTEFPLAIHDYNITIPKLMFQNIADTVHVKLNVDYIPFQKK